jgi:hypothetical protein
LADWQMPAVESFGWTNIRQSIPIRGSTDTTPSFFPRRYTTTTKPFGKSSSEFIQLYLPKVYSIHFDIYLIRNEKSKIRVWDSSNPLAEEYVRGCATLKRDELFEIDDRPYPFKDVAYADCNDYIHTGYSALSQATQLLFNDICNY